MATITEDLKRTGTTVREAATGLLREAAALSHAAMDNDVAEELAHTVRLKVKKTRRAVENAVDRYEEAVQCVKRQPLLAVGVTFVSGLLLGLLVARLRAPRTSAPLPATDK